MQTATASEQTSPRVKLDQARGRAGFLEPPDKKDSQKSKRREYRITLEISEVLFRGQHISTLWWQRSKPRLRHSCPELEPMDQRGMALAILEKAGMWGLHVLESYHNCTFTVRRRGTKEASLDKNKNCNSRDQKCRASVLVQLRY